jgi:putative ABC transport system ATP-binding protein
MKWSRKRTVDSGVGDRICTDSDLPLNDAVASSDKHPHVEQVTRLTQQASTVSAAVDNRQPVLALQSVWKTFDADRSSPVHALRGVDLEVAPHESVAIIGPSGSGKSTLLNILGCLDIPTRGTYLLNGTDVATLTDAGRAAVRGREIGFVFQQFHLLSHRSVLENVELGTIYGTTDQPPPARKERIERALDALHRVGLDHRVDATARTLSGGEKQRVAIARAITSRPALLLADEPTGNLDTRNTHTVLDVFDRLQADGLTLVVITHDPSVARRLQRSVAITDGYLTAQPAHNRATANAN